jgi:hypothetical protein
VGLLNGTPELGVLPVVDNAVQAAALPVAGPPADLGMPATGAGEDMFALTALAIGLLALAGIAGGALVRVRNR